MSEASFVALKCYDRSGFPITLSLVLAVDAATFGDSEAQGIQRTIAALVGAGFTVEAPGVSEGDRVEKIGWFCRRARMDRNGEEIPVIDVYPDTDNPEVKYKMTTFYLNTIEEVADFEAHSGMKLSDLPFYDNEQPMERTSKNAPKYLRQPPSTLKIVLVHNPAFDPDETDQKKKKPKFKFDRWLESASGASGASNAPNGSNSTASSEKQEAGDVGGSSNVVGSITGHWSEDKRNQKMVADRLASYGITGKAKINDALDKIEDGLKRVGDSKAHTVQEFLGWIDQTFSAPPEVSDEDSVPF